LPRLSVCLGLPAHRARPNGSPVRRRPQASLGFKKLAPKIVSMYDQRFWQHER
jgi:hypothetical protein